MFKLSIMQLSTNILIKKRGILSYTTVARFREILKEHLKVDDATAKKIASVKLDHIIRYVPANRIVHNCLLCQKHNIQLAPLHHVARCLCLKSNSLEHKIYFLEDIGATNITVLHINRMVTNMKCKTVYKFRKMYNIPHDVNILGKLVDSIGGVPLHSVSFLKTRSDFHPFYTIYESCLFYYRVKKLKISEMSNMVFPNANMVYSFRLLNRLLHFLTVQLGFDFEFIKDHSYMMNISIFNAHTVLRDLENLKINGYRLPDLIRKSPYLFLYDVQNIKSLLNTFSKYDIPEVAVSSCLQIFGLEHDVVVERMLQFLNTPDINIWRTHPRILYVLLNKGLVKNRVECLRTLNLMRFANIHVITSPKSYFIRYINDEIRCMAHKRYIAYILEKHLGEDSQNLIQYLARHPYWATAGYLETDKMLCYLKTRYSVEDIRQGIHIILYPLSAVKKMLPILHNEYSPENGYYYTSAQYLMLCVYMMEKHNHFSGDAIWNFKNCSTPQATPLLPPPFSTDASAFSTYSDCPESDSSASSILSVDEEFQQLEENPCDINDDENISCTDDLLNGLHNDR